MKVAILGGSFNPPHICHVFVTHFVLATSNVDQLWLLPCYQHAFGKPLVAFHHRLEMCALAVAPFQQSRVKVLPFERDREGTSWTIESVRFLHQRYPTIEFVWVIGTDVLYELHKWKDFDELQQLISFCVVPRAGSFQKNCSGLAGHPAPAQDRDQEILRRLQTQSDDLNELGFQFPNVSSSLIRERVKQHQSIYHLVPRDVAKYIERHRLYQD